MKDVKETIRQHILANYLQGEIPENLRDDTPLRSSGILDSMATIGLMTFVEKEFGIELDVYETTVDRCDNIQALAAIVARKRAG